MNDKRRGTSPEPPTDSKIASDWAAVLERLADLNSRTGGDTRRRAILKRLGALKPASLR